LAQPLAEIVADATRRRVAAPDALTQRMIALAGLALADAIAAAEPERPGRARATARPPIALLLALPDQRDSVTPPDAAALWPALTSASGLAIDAQRSRTFPRGRAAIFEALTTARELLAREPDTIVVCGGVDSYADETRVMKEHAQGRTMGGPYAGDGRVLGEAAGMLVVEPVAKRRGGVVVQSVGRYDDPGHRFGREPARGEGLSNAIEAMRGAGDTRTAYRVVWAGLVGESFEAKQFGVARLRHRDRLVDETRVEHPADRLGDAGAGLGAMLFVDATQRLIAGRRESPALVWAISDHGPIGAATLELEATGGSR
ncbi:MAG TPA: hypothetical protein VG755_03285, partial [Nannocystaceae bacterium]|nr:hypothetical protein [Nannocystaceae bacterium]